MPLLTHAFAISRPFDPNLSFFSSPFFSHHILASIRLFLAFYTLLTLIVAIIWAATNLHNANSFFSYFTHLSYIGLCAYLFASGVQTMIYAWCPFKKGSLVLREWPRFLQFLHVWLYTTVVTFPIVVTVVYWALLSGPSTFSKRFDAWSNISMHALNTAFVLFEILLTNVPPPPWIYLPLNVAILACYLGIAYITSATQHFYTYSFLNPKKEGGLLAAYIVGIAVCECVAYGLIYGVIVLRQKFTRRIGAVPGDGARSRVPDEAVDEWQQVSKPDSIV
ncbi:hypothetical protein F5887DRAFT_1106899 [Amanita rubescens]|nr:hypothetical protein F5887DRAFT_1106899 [Amanita rubescens]